MKQDATMKKCPRCGSKLLHKESSLNRDVSVVICQECESVFELHKRRGSPRPRSLREDNDDFDERRWQDYLEEDDDGESEDESDYAEAGEEYELDDEDN